MTTTEILKLILLMMQQGNPAIFEDYYIVLMQTAIKDLDSPK